MYHIGSTFMLSMIPCCVFSAAAIEGSQPGEGVLPISNSSSRKIGLEKSKLKPMKATRDHGRHMVVDREHIGVEQGKTGGPALENACRCLTRDVFICASVHVLCSDRVLLWCVLFH